MKSNHFWCVFCLLFCTLVQGLPAAVQAAPPDQAAEVQVYVINELDTSICMVLFSVPTAADWGNNHLGNDSIIPGETYSLTLPAGIYDVLVVDCHQHILMEKRALSLQDGDELHVTQRDAKRAECDARRRQGQQLLRQSDYAKAAEALQVAAACYHAIDDLAGEGASLANIGLVYADQGRYADALQQYAVALKLVKAMNNRPVEGTIYQNMAAVYREQGQYTEALQYYLWSLTIKRAEGDRHGEATTLNSIGLLYENQVQADKALAYYQQALAIRQEIGDRFGEAVTLHNIGALYNLEGHVDQALTYLQRALTLARDVGDRHGEGETLHIIGQIHINQGQYDAALADFQQALAIARDIGDRPAEGYNLHRIGLVYYNQQHYDQALQVFEQALAIAQAIGDRPVEGDILSIIGASYAVKLQNVKALTYYQQAIDVVESVRATAGNEAERASFIAQRITFYDQAIRLQLQQKQIANAFLMSERGRARSFLDSLATGQVELSDAAASELLMRENEAYAVRRSVQAALDRAKAYNPPDPKLVADLTEQAANAATAYEQALSAIRSRHDQLSTLIPGRTNSVLSLTEVQKLLDDQTTLISYWLLNNTTWAFVVTAQNYTVVELPAAKPAEIRNALSALYTWSNRENPHPRSLRNLEDWLIAPLLAHIHTPHVAIIPHQLLHYVPFAALTDGESYFGQQHTLSILPSASTLFFLQVNAQRGQANPSHQALVFGNPTTDNPKLPSLAYAVSEAQAIATLLHTSVYTTSAASEASLRSNVAGANIVHLAAHGSYNADNPLDSLIALAPGGGDDGHLETQEIFGLPLRGNDLVVLSACETNVGQLSRGDEVVGLTRAFFFAGAPTVISSLWSVNDAATEALMVSFYRHWLQEGMTKAAALQTAQADVRADPRWKSPFYWAGFVLNGDPGKSNHFP